MASTTVWVPAKFISCGSVGTDQAEVAGCRLWKKWDYWTVTAGLLSSWRRTRIINLPKNQKGYDTFETTVGKLSARRIQIFPDYFCLGIILKVILNNFQNNA